MKRKALHAQYKRRDDLIMDKLDMLRKKKEKIMVKVMTSLNEATQIEKEIQDIIEEVRNSSEIDDYNPEKDGIVYVMRIFYPDNKPSTPMVELALGSGRTISFQWTNEDLRKKFSPGISGHTFIFDERVGRFNFSDFIKTKGGNKK